MKDINKYLPKVISNIREYKSINKSLDYELENLNIKFTNIKNNNIIRTTSEKAIIRLEQSLKISSVGNLDLRRFKLQNLYQNKLPLNIKWLQNKLTAITGSSTAYQIINDYENYTIQIKLNSFNTEWMTEINRELRILIPANLKLEISGQAYQMDNIYYGIGTFIGYKLQFSS